MWTKVTANIGQVMGNLAKAHDEIQLNDDLARLERLIDEVHIFNDEAAKKEEIILAREDSIEK